MVPILLNSSQPTTIYGWAKVIELHCTNKTCIETKNSLFELN